MAEKGEESEEKEEAEKEKEEEEMQEIKTEVIRELKGHIASHNLG